MERPSHVRSEIPLAIRLFKHYWQLPFAVIALIELVALAISPMLAVMTLDMLHYGAVVTPDITPHWGLVIIFTAVDFVLMVAMGLYHARQRS